MTLPTVTFIGVALVQVGIVGLVLFGIWSRFPAGASHVLPVTAVHRVGSWLLFWLAAFVPAVGVAILYKYSSWSLGVPLGWLPTSVSILDSLILRFMVTLLLAFLINLLLPVAGNARQALLFALAAFIVHYYFYVFPFFWGSIAETLFPGDMLGMGFWDFLYGIVSLFASLATWLCIAGAGWLGTVSRSRLPGSSGSR